MAGRLTYVSPLGPSSGLGIETPTRGETMMTHDPITDDDGMEAEILNEVDADGMEPEIL